MITGGPPRSRIWVLMLSGSVENKVLGMGMPLLAMICRVRTLSRARVIPRDRAVLNTPFISNCLTIAAPWRVTFVPILGMTTRKAWLMSSPS